MHMGTGRSWALFAAIGLGFVVWGVKPFLVPSPLPPASISDGPSSERPAIGADTVRQQPTVLEAEPSPDGRSIESPRNSNGARSHHGQVGAEPTDGLVPVASPDLLVSPPINLLPSR
jgi:hypothetical protein